MKKEKINEKLFAKIGIAVFIILVIFLQYRFNIFKNTIIKIAKNNIIIQNSEFIKRSTPAQATSANNIASGTSNTCSWLIDSNGKLIVWPTNNIEGTLASMGNNNTSAPWYNFREQIKTVEFETKVYAGTSIRALFDGCENLTSIDFTNFDTTNTTNMYRLFMNCKNLNTINLTGFKTNNVTNMQSMFYNCNSLTQLQLNEFDTGKVENMRTMFYGCNSLETLNLESFDTTIVNTMYCMFYNCNSLREINLSSFNTSNVTNMQSMFYRCEALENLDLSSFNTINVDNMSHMFYNCYSLKELDISGFNTTNTTTMVNMFFNLAGLHKIKIGNTTNLKTDQVYAASFGRGMWLKEEDGLEYSATEICTKSLTGNATGTYTKLSNMSKEMSVDFPVTYKIEKVYHIDEFTTNRNDIFSLRDNHDVIARVPLIDTNEYEVPGQISLKFENMVTDANGNKYDLKMDISNIKLYDLKSATGLSESITDILKLEGGAIRFL